jgi:hypothetical protein
MLTTLIIIKSFTHHGSTKRRPIDARGGYTKY